MDYQYKYHKYKHKYRNFKNNMNRINNKYKIIAISGISGAVKPPLVKKLLN